MDSTYAAFTIAASFGVGVCCGYFLGSRLPPRKETHMPVTPGRKRLLNLLTVLMMLVIASGLVLSWLLVKTRADLAESVREFTEYQTCQADYQQRFATTYSARAGIAEPISAADDAVFRAILALLDGKTTDADQLRDAIEYRIEVRRDQRRERADNPIPPLPDQVCGTSPVEVN